MKEYIVFLQPINTVLEVVRTAKNKGYKIIALISEMLPCLPPYGTAISCIDHFIKVNNWDDYQSIIKSIDNLVMNDRVVGTYFAIEPVALLNTILRKNYNLPCNDVDTIKRITNKLAVRHCLIESGLSNLKYVRHADFSNWEHWPYRKAYYFKPTYGSGSLCVKRCTSVFDIQEALSDWGRYSNDDFSSDLYLDKYHVFSSKEDSFYLEEEFQGELISVEGVSHDGEFYPLGLLSRILFSENSIVEMGSCFPYPHPEIEKVLKKVIDAHKVLGIKFGATHTELIVGSNGQIEIIDLNPRFVGADVMMSINYAYDISIQELLLNSALGKKPNLYINKEKSKFSCLQYILAPDNLDVFVSLNLPKEHDVLFTRVCMESGTKLRSTDTQSDVLGAYLVVGDTFEAAINRSKELRENVLINGKFPGRF